MEREFVIELMVFDFGELRIGVDTEAILSLHQEEASDNVPDSTLLTDDFSCRTPEESPRLMRVMSSGGPKTILVPMPESIITVSGSSIRALPPLFNRFQKTIPVWGVALRDGEMVLMLDMEKYISLNSTVSDNI